MHNNTKIENISITLAKIINAKKFMATLTIKVMINIITKIKLIITITEKKISTLIIATTQLLKWLSEDKKQAMRKH